GLPGVQLPRRRRPARLPETLPGRRPVGPQIDQSLDAPAPPLADRPPWLVLLKGPSRRSRGGRSPAARRQSDDALVHHGVGDLEEAGDVGAVDVVAGDAEAL